MPTAVRLGALWGEDMTEQRDRRQGHQHMVWNYCQHIANNGNFPLQLVVMDTPLGRYWQAFVDVTNKKERERA